MFNERITIFTYSHLILCFFFSAEVKQAIVKAFLNLPHTSEWKNKFAKFGILKFVHNSDVAYDGQVAQMWACQSEKLNVRYY